MNGKLNGRATFLIPTVVALVSAGVVFGVMQSRVGENHERIDRLQEVKAETVVVEQMQTQLNRIEDKVDRLLMRGSE